MTLKLWADQEGDGERSCCSPQAVIGARALAHSMGLPHLTLDLEDSFRAAVVDPFVAEHDAGRTPNPCVRCNGEVRFDAMLGACRAPRRRCARHGPLRAHRARRGGAAAGPRRRPPQGPDLHALRPAAGRARARAVPARRPDQGRRCARSPAAAGLPVADKRESQDLCFLAGTSRERFLARHGGVRDRPGEVVDASGRVLGQPPGPPSLHRRAAPRAGRGRRGAAVRAGHRRGREPGRRRPAGGARRGHRRAAGRDAEPRRGARRQREAALPLRAAAAAGWPRRRGTTTPSRRRSPSRRSEWRPARPPA